MAGSILEGRKPLLEASQGLVNAFDIVGKAETQPALRTAAEVDPRGNADMGLLEDSPGQAQGVAIEMVGPGKDVIGAHRLAGDREAELDEALVENLPPLRILFGHGLEGCFAFLERGDGGGLCQRAGATYQWSLTLL